MEFATSLMRSIAKQLPLLLAILLTGTSVSAQEMSFAHITRSDGLSTNFVNTVCQDRKGFIWIGTENGLQRYDGNSFVSINSADPESQLPGLPVDEIIPDTLKNILWLRMGMVVGKFNPVNGEFKQAFIKAGNLPTGPVAVFLKKDSRGNIILVVSFSGAYVYNEQNNAFEENNDVIAVPPQFALLNIFEDARHGLFYLCGAEGLKVFDKKKKTFYDGDHNPGHLPELEATKAMHFVQYVYLDRENRFWISASLSRGRQQLFLLDRQNNKLISKNIEPSDNAYAENFALAENHGRLFCYGTNVLNIYDNRTGLFKKFYDKSAVNFATIKKLFSDRDDNLWIISDNGLYEAIVFGNYKHQGKLPGVEQSPITSFTQLDSNKLVATSWGGGVNIFKFNNDELRLVKAGDVPTLHSSKTTFAWSMAYDSNSKKITAGYQNGVVATARLQDHFSNLSSPGIFNGSSVRQVVLDRHGSYWYGTQSGAVIKETGGSFSIVKQYSYSFIARMVLDNHGWLWICTGGLGLRVIDTESDKEVAGYTSGDSSNALASNHVNDIVQLNDSIYVIALDRNIEVLNTNQNKFRYINYDDGLPNNTVYSLVKDRHNQVWMSTNIGIVKYVYEKDEFQAYSQKDGLVTANNNDDILYTGLQLNNGMLIFGGEKGNYIMFHPDSIGNLQQPHDATITDIKLFNRFIPVDSVMEEGGLNLDYNNNTITINFTALTYGVANTLDYYYRLKGASDIWIKAGKPYAASYASLAPGDYVFEVKCENEAGLQSPHITTLNISIAKPYWQTWWFIALVILVAFIPLFIIYKLRINRIKAVQRIREKVARDLHDDVGSTLTSINILSEMSRNKVDDNVEEVKSYLNKITDNSSQMMDAMDDIVWNIKPANDTMVKIEARMREYAANIFEPKDIGYKFTDDAKVKSISLNMDVRRSLFLIFKETLNNIAKYANASLVTINFSVRKHELHLAIIDDGIGFEATDTVYGNGIENMKKRAQGFKGSYTVKSYPGKGTHVLLVIPLGKYYA